jgi:cysteine desulfurase/selenocysteine lyase
MDSHTALLASRFLQARSDFPFFSQPIVYLDSAATTHKPSCVLDAMMTFYKEQYATVHRTVYQESHKATELYDDARHSVCRFLHASSPREIIFTRGATDSINMLAESMMRSVFTQKSRILVSELEHHSNYLPWLLAAQHTCAKFDIIPVTDEGHIRLDILKNMLQEPTTLVAISHCSNVLGTVAPIHEIADMVHAQGAYLLVDGAQSVPHIPLDVSNLGCDFLCFSAHKMYGPTGIGVLWGKEDLLQKLPPPRLGGGMVETVDTKCVTWSDLPLKFEPGTPMVAEAIGLGAAIEYLEKLGRNAVYQWEQFLGQYLYDRLKEIPGCVCLGPSHDRGSILSFHIPNVHPLDIATLLSASKICVRSGNMCCQPLLRRLGYSALTRVSCGLYNTQEDIDVFVHNLCRILDHLR